MPHTRPKSNIAAFLPELAAQQPDVPALHVPVGKNADGTRKYASWTYQELDSQSDRIARGLTSIGVGRGVRTTLMVKPSLEFFALTFGIFKAGAVPVLVDPGIGLKNLKTCLAEAEPEAFIGIPPAHVARLALGWARDSLKTLITVGRRLFWGGMTLEQVKEAGDAAGSGAFVAETEATDPAAILFTSGSTGVPKGVVYEHRHFVAQVDLIRESYGIEPGEVDLPTFPLFALFDPALGMTTVVPDMDFTKPASVDPAHLVDIAQRFGATNMFGSPALLNTLGRHDEATGARMPKLRRVISAGAPVPAPVMERVLGMLPEGALIHTPYGATENLPVATIASDVLLGETWAETHKGAGVCVGRPVDPNDVRIIRITDDAIETWDDDLCVPIGEMGEITVYGPTTTETYYGREASTRLAKIRDGERIRHRMGDLGYLDTQGRIWFCGRKSHRVRTADGDMYTVPCEAVFNTHPAVYRTALVGVGEAGDQTPVLCVELEADTTARWDDVKADLARIAGEFDHTRTIQRFLQHPGFPVDIRHNAKIGREALSVWAAKRSGG
jgi:acyl-CoA synthetase (AMP-forming)/AMP-acid ligase II